MSQTPSPAARPAPAAAHPPTGFEKLIKAEYERLDTCAGAGLAGQVEQFKVASSEVTDEPWVQFTTRDSFGLCLSGGGIRSATFNLGLLQALARLGVLPHIDYVSTVSGGGYTGSFWTAWLHRHGSQSKRFPVPPEPENGVRDERETPEIRHLREFSRFLMPRLGFQFEETRTAIVAVLGGMMPALTAAASVIALTFYAWLFVSGAVLTAPPMAGAIAITLVSAGIHGYFQWRSGKRRGETHPQVDFRACLLLGLCTGAVWWAWYSVYRYYVKPDADWSAFHFDAWSIMEDRLAPGNVPFRHAVLFPALVWVTVGGLLLFCRFFAARFNQRRVDATRCIELMAARCFAAAVAVGLMAALWMTAEWLNHRDARPIAGGAVTTGFAAIFFWLRNWLTEPREDTRATSLFDRIWGKLKPVIPQAAAAAAALSMCLSIAMVLERYPSHRIVVIGIFIALGVLLGMLIIFNPARIGLHDFYRSRLCRCYLGASRARNRDIGRIAAEIPEDDLTFKELRETKTPRAPIHLVCCAANNLAGDPLSTLYRGARSVTISPLGVTVGEHSALPEDNLRLSSAMTASAAAFNSQMGQISMGLGPAVAFVMSALNLRLGLWVPHPARESKANSVFPGAAFFLEMFSRSHTSNTRFLHLSDGGHFENLGLYELVRRHCRYVIVSDSSADPEVAFDDLANTLRRIREDFGVELELDVEPLRPDADGRSRQHAVVGTIHYDGPTGSDKGSIIYFKPTLTGDEPPDVLQYRTRNVAFPHESTGDQFYDEAQWESYRRLGEHAAHVILSCAETHAKESSFADFLFIEASLRWSRDRQRLNEKFLELTARVGELEADLRENAPIPLLREFFPEADIARPRNAQDALQYSAEDSSDNDVKTLFFLMRIIQLMEDVWVVAELDEYWSLPLNAGWMSYLQRWASTATFRYWWPILRANYSIGFRDFVRDRFGIRLRDPSGRDFKWCDQLGGNPAAKDPDASCATLKLRPVTDFTAFTEGHAAKQWDLRHGRLFQMDRTAIEYTLTLCSVAEQRRSEPIQVAFLLYTLETEGPVKRAIWRQKEFYVPPPMVGAGITARFLEAVITHFIAKTEVTELQVIIEEPSPDDKPARRLGRALRLERVQTISFYKSRGFKYGSNSPGTLHLQLNREGGPQRRNAAIPKGISGNGRSNTASPLQ
jgi:Patatin-like phospholipase